MTKANMLAKLILNAIEREEKPDVNQVELLRGIIKELSNYARRIERQKRSHNVNNPIGANHKLRLIAGGKSD